MKITTNSMRIFFKGLKSYISTIVACVSLLLTTGCSMEADNTIGFDIVPESQKMELRHLKFRGNNLIQIDKNGYNVSTPLTGKNLVETRQYRTDSLLSSMMKTGYLGVRRSDIFGLRSAGFASSMIYMNLINDDEGFGYRPIFDTLFLILSVSNYGGDTLVPINYKVYEIKESLLGNVLNTEDSTAYINCDLSPIYDESKPLFTFTYPIKELGQGPNTGYIALTPTPGNYNGLSEHTWDYVRRLMLIPEDTNDWDGYATSGIGAYQNEGYEWLDELRSVITGNIDYACKYIAEHFEGVTFSQPQGTYMLFIDCEKWLETHGKTMDELLKAGWDVGVVWQDGRAFHGKTHIRMNLALPLSRVEEAFQRLDKYVFNA